MKIPFFIQEFTDEMEEAAIHALRNESFVGGESVSKFEEEFAKYTGTKYAVAVNSGTSAIEAPLRYYNIKGKNVIGGDVACLMPTKDNPNQITSMVASAVMFEIICLISLNLNK